MKNKDEKGRFLPGHTVTLKHGLYSKKVPLPGKRKLDRYLAHVQRELEEAIPEASPQMKLLISQAVRTEAIQRILEVYFKNAGLLDPGKFRRGKLDTQPAMREYFAAMAHQRQALQALGLDKKQIEEIFDLQAYLKLKDKEREDETKTD